MRATATTARDHELVAGLMRIAAVAGDGHTTVYRWRGFRYLPLALTRLADGLYVTAASAPLGASLGLRVVAVGDVTAAELEARAAPFVSHENEAWLRVQVATAAGDPRDAARARRHERPRRGDASGSRPRTARACELDVSARPRLRRSST